MYIPPKIVLMLEALVGPSLVEDWWTRENRAFELKTPKQVYEEGREAEVFNYLFDFLQK